MELIVQAKNAGEEDIIVLAGEEDVFDVEEEVVEENEEVWEASTRRSAATRNNLSASEKKNAYRMNKAVKPINLIFQE